MIEDSNGSASEKLKARRQLAELEGEREARALGLSEEEAEAIDAAFGPVGPPSRQSILGSGDRDAARALLADLEGRR